MQQLCQVVGRNCIGPTAPADETPTVRPIRVSCRWMAASQYQAIPVAALGLAVVAEQLVNVAADRRLSTPAPCRWEVPEWGWQPGEPGRVDERERSARRTVVRRRRSQRAPPRRVLDDRRGSGTAAAGEPRRRLRRPQRCSASVSRAASASAVRSPVIRDGVGVVVDAIGSVVVAAIDVVAGVPRVDVRPALSEPVQPATRSAAASTSALDIVRSEGGRARARRGCCASRWRCHP